MENVRWLLIWRFKELGSILIWNIKKFSCNFFIKTYHLNIENMTLIPLIEQKHSQDNFSGWKRNCKFVKPMFLPVEIKLQNNDGVLIFLMFVKFSWSQKQNVYTLGIYKESVSANSCSHDTLLNKFLCDKPKRGKKGKKKCEENTKYLYFTLNKFNCPLQISNIFPLWDINEHVLPYIFSTSRRKGKKWQILWKG